MRLVKAGFVLIALSLVVSSADGQRACETIVGQAPRPAPAGTEARLHWIVSQAQTPAPPAADADLEAVIAEARAWVTKPATDRRIEAFSPAAEIRYREYQKPRPLRVWITRVDLTAPGVRLAVTEPLGGEPRKPKEETRSASTLDFARQRGVQLAINASAFDPFRSRTGMPMNVVGLAAVRGQAYSDADERFGALYITRDGRVALKSPPLTTEDLWHVTPGFRMLVDDGRFAVLPRVAQSKFGGVNPRTAVGVDREGAALWIIVVDGRQGGASEGITLIELACLLQSLGVWDALNLDGGGSSTLVLESSDGNHRVVNRPVGRGKPNTLRQVANNLGLYLPGKGFAAARSAPPNLREAVIRIAASRRGGGYRWKGDGVARDVVYDGKVVLRADAEGSYCCGATLEAFLDAYRVTHVAPGPAAANGRWFQDWPLERFEALWNGWYGTESAPANPLLPESARPTIREKQVYHVLPWAGFGKPVADYRLLERGDFVEFWRKSGSGHSVIFWGRDFDKQGRERLWYWSSQGKPRHAYPETPGGEPVKTPGYGVNWEYVGDEIDPQRIYGVRLIEAPDVPTSPRK